MCVRGASLPLSPSAPLPVLACLAFNMMLHTYQLLLYSYYELLVIPLDTSRSIQRSVPFILLFQFPGG